MSPIVSVLMTAFNREKYIAEAIESVLASTYKDFELIIVDDCSTDNTVNIAKKYEAQDSRVKVYVNEKNLGDYPNRNKAASFATGKYIKYLDSDDIMYPHCLQVMVSAIEKFPSAGYGLSCNGDFQVPYPKMLLPYEAYLENFNGLNHFDRAPGSSIINRQIFNELGGFSGERMIGDNELWLKISRTYPLVKFQVDLYWARTHEGQESTSNYAKSYNILRKRIFFEAINHKNCPLSSEEKKQILKKLRARNFKNILLKLIFLFRRNRNALPKM
jgi:glycosyltransferase involved in cell wall biosynthesis